jgi:putative IMPACT (imprinted ancient) family translation regulator
MKKPSADERVVAAREGRAEIRERASRFLAFASPVSSPGEAAQAVARLRREYHDATHVAFAWKIGSGATAAQRSSDAGEPSGTAGKPIAAAIASAGISDVLVAVVRYFGGTKLGTGGLSGPTGKPPTGRSRPPAAGSSGRCPGRRHDAPTTGWAL